MRVLTLGRNASIYSSNVHLLLGGWSGIDDVNTPIDTIYFGHGEPLTDRCNERLLESLRLVRRASAPS